MLAGKFSDRKIWDSSANWPTCNHKSVSRRHLALSLDCSRLFCCQLRAHRSAKIESAAASRDLKHEHIPRISGVG